MKPRCVLLPLLIMLACRPADSPPVSDTWMLGPFVKIDSINPVLSPQAHTTFWCPVREDTVRWEQKDVFNPAAVVRKGQVYLLYRAEDTVGAYNGTSRLGLAHSTDGFHFVREPEPVFYPDRDSLQQLEWEGGCEDPRIVEDSAGTYYMTYTAYDGDKARLFVASSPDLVHWTKHGSAFRRAEGGKYARIWSKSGAIVARPEGHRLVATRLQGKYWMYFGESNIYAATSENLIDWTPLPETDPDKLVYDSLRGHWAFQVIFAPRPGKFDSYLVESGPPAILTEDGIVFIYNARNAEQGGDPAFPGGTYAAGQVLLDPEDPTQVLARSAHPFFWPDRPYELSGQVNNVSFLEGLVPFDGRWFLY
ncbi:MAG: glycosidase, partial [Bacteroidetes bacterium]